MNDHIEMRAGGLVAVGTSEKGIGLQVAFLPEGKTEYETAVVFMTPVEAGRAVCMIERAQAVLEAT